MGGGKFVAMACRGVRFGAVAEGGTGARFVREADEGKRERRSGYRKGNEPARVSLVLLWAVVSERSENQERRGDQGV